MQKMLFLDMFAQIINKDNLQTSEKQHLAVGYISEDKRFVSL